MAENSGWFDTGKGAVDRAYQKSRSFNLFRRFYLKPGAEAIIAFCDGDNSPEEPIGNYKEHSYDLMTGTGPNFASCVGASRGCPFCEKRISPYDAWPFTIIQIAPTWTDREGKEHANERKILVAKKEAMQRILRHMSQRKGMTGTIWNIFRSSDRAYTIGDDWQFMEKIEGGRAKLAEFLAAKIPVKNDKGAYDWVARTEPLPTDTSRFDYPDILKPKSREELEADGVDFEGTKRKQESRWSSNKRGDDKGSPAPSASPARSAGVPYDA